MANRKGDFNATEAREEVILRMRQGWSYSRIADHIGKTEKSIEYYRQDPDFRQRMDAARAYFNREGEPVELPEFPVFSEKYLGMKLFPHQLQWHEVLEGRVPQNLHHSQNFVEGDENMLIINTPPFHAKTTCISINYVVWRILQNPNIHVAIISKTQTRAKEILLSIAERLSSKNRMFQELKDDFAPPDGFDNNSVWTASRIYLNPEVRDAGDKDPTVQALGITQQLYGSRLDLMVLDDCVDLSNAHEYDKQVSWIQKIASTRMDLTGDGQIVLVGTRLAQDDLYMKIQNPSYYSEGESPWTYLTQPAVLEFDVDAANWVTLWPKSNRPLMASSARKKRNAGKTTADENGLFIAWDGESLNKVRKSMDAEGWARVYMQYQVSDSTTFQAKDIDGCTNALRVPGPMVPSKRGHREGGMSGLHVIGGVDPATEGYTAVVIYGLDIQSGRRYILDIHNQKQMLPHQLNALLKHWTVLYGVREWRVETVAHQRVIIQDQDLLTFMRGKGVQLNPHITNRNKWDEVSGVASMAMLFKGWEDGVPLIELPKRTGHFGVQSLCDQLVGWYPTPSRSAKAPIQDTVMALWFCELRARELSVHGHQSVDFFDDGLLSPMDKENQFAVDLNEWNRQSNLDNWHYTAWRDDGSGSW